jgi:PBP1b-binding outer membrane lipoprotein LpoB
MKKFKLLIVLTLILALFIFGCAQEETGDV